MSRPIAIPFSKQADANGAAVIPLPLERTGDHRLIKVIAQAAAGSAEWGLMNGASPINFGRGRRSVMGPELLLPQDTVSLVMTGATPLTEVTGAISGKGGSADEILPLWNPSPNTIAVDTSAPELYLGRVTAPGSGAPAVQNFVLPPNTYALALLTSSSVGGIHATSVNVQGVITGITYANINSGVFPGGIPTDVIYVPIGTAALDTSVKVGFGVSGAVGQPFMDVVAMLAPIAIAATIAGIGTTPIPSAGQDTSNPSQQSIPVVPALNYKAPPWQAANQTPVTQFRNSVGITTLVTGVASEVIYPQWGQLVIDSGASCVATIEDNAGTPNILLELGPQVNGMIFGRFSGDPMPAGNSIRMQVYSLTGAGNVRAIFGFSGPQ